MRQQPWKTEIDFREAMFVTALATYADQRVKMGAKMTPYFVY